MRNRRPRLWETRDENDPLAGLVNLFDLWMVFSIALLIVFAGSSHRRNNRRDEGRRSPDEPQPVALRRAETLRRFRLSQEELRGSGEKLGTAYRLASGEVVCVPDAEGKP
ncbi:MAG: DUF2149 domain-containing protein [Isosphaeraceae bacterium]|nr:DUF2149 domain-containing protein [Isosphaeraceae bacterium]